MEMFTIWLSLQYIADSLFVNVVCSKTLYNDFVWLNNKYSYQNYFVIV